MAEERVARARPRSRAASARQRQPRPTSAAAPPRRTRERAAGSGPAGRRMRARLARMATKSQSENPVLEPLFRAVSANHPKADLALLERAYLTAERHHARPDAQERRPLHHPPARGDDDPGRARHDRADAVAALLHDTVEDTPYTLDAAARATSATRSRCSSTASPSSTRSSTATPPRPRPSAR